MSLLSADDYDELTRDGNAPVEASVVVALSEAQSLFEEELHRPLETGEVAKERVRIYPDFPGGVTGFAYPKRRPITSVSDPKPPANFDHASIRYVGGAFVPGLFFVQSTSDPYPYGYVSYTGGFPARGQTIVDDNGESVVLPSTLAIELAWATFGLLHPDRTVVRDGALVISTGTDRIQYATPRVVNGQLTAETKQRISRYKRRQLVLG